MVMYEYLSDLTETYLDGKLKGLQLNYEGNEHVVIHLIYQDRYDFKYSYVVVIDLVSKTISSASHTSDGYLSTVKIDRHKLFESMIFDQIFNTEQIENIQLIA